MPMPKRLATEGKHCYAVSRTEGWNGSRGGAHDDVQVERALTAGLVDLTRPSRRTGRVRRASGALECRMTSRSRKVIASMVTAVGIAVVVAAGFAFRPALFEQWYLWKLKSRDESERTSAAERLAEMRSVRAAPRLARILCEFAAGQPYLTFGDGTSAYFPGRRMTPDHYSAEALVRIGPPALPALVEALATEDVRVHACVYSTLLTIGPATPQEVPSLTELTTHENAEVRRKAVNVLRLSGSAVSAAIPDLILALDDEDEQVQSLAVSALRAIGPARGPEVHAVIDILKDKKNSARVRRHAATALEHELAIPALRASVEDPQDAFSVRRAAVWTLGKLDTSPSAVRALSAALAAPDRSLRWIAAVSLRNMGPVAREAAPQLRRALRDEDRFVRAIAAEALRNFESSASSLPEG